MYFVWILWSELNYHFPYFAWSAFKKIPRTLFLSNSWTAFSHSLSQFWCLKLWHLLIGCGQGLILWVVISCPFAAFSHDREKENPDASSLLMRASVHWVWLKMNDFPSFLFPHMPCLQHSAVETKSFSMQLSTFLRWLLSAASFIVQLSACESEGVL